MKILCIIPARGGSKGIKNKNLIKLSKKPLLHYSIDSAKNSKIPMKIVVSSDSQKILSYAKKFNVQTISRPKKLSNSKTRIEPVISHTLNFLKKTENYLPDLIVLLQNTSPLRNSNHVKSSIQQFKKGKYDSMLSGYLSHYFIWEEKNKQVFPKNYNPQNRPNRQEMKSQFIENGAIYITKYRSFLKSKSRISGKIGLYKMNELCSIDVDTPFDLFLAKKILEKNPNFK